MRLSSEKISKNLLLGGIALLFVRWGNFETTKLPKPFEILFVISVIFLFLSIIKKPQSVRLFLKEINKKILLALAAIIGMSLVGLFISLFITPVAYHKVMLLDYLRMLFAIASFLMVFYFSWADKGFAKKTYLALLSPLIYSIFFIIPARYLTSHSLLSPESRLYGFTNNPSTLAKLLLVAFLLAFGVFLFCKNKNICWISGVGLVLLWGLNFWTGSRQGFLGIGVGIVLGFGILIYQKVSPKRIIYLFLATFLILLLGILVVPNQAQKTTISRTLHLAAVVKIPASNSIPIDLRGTDNRVQTIWPYFVKQVLKNPLGEGPGYYTHNYVLAGINNDLAGAHNSFLEAGLYGGWLALLGFLYLIFKTLVTGIRSLNKEQTYLHLGLLLSFVGLVLAIMFDDAFKLFWLWIIMGLILGLGHHSKKTI